MELRLVTKKQKDSLLPNLQAISWKKINLMIALISTWLTILKQEYLWCFGRDHIEAIDTYSGLTLYLR